MSLTSLNDALGQFSALIVNCWSCIVMGTVRRCSIMYAVREKERGTSWRAMGVSEELLSKRDDEGQCERV